MWSRMAEHLDEIRGKVSGQVWGHELRETIQADSNFLGSRGKVLRCVVGKVTS